MDGGDLGSRLSTPVVENLAQNQNSDGAIRTVGLDSRSIPGMDDSQLVGVPLAVAGDVAVPVTPGDPQVNTVGQLIEKRKRGRPPRGQAAVPKPPPPLKRIKEKEEEVEEEDVCFICFDGGSLVLCDRKGCPKAYHAACIKRDEAFFRSKAKWNCGWHICSVCQKAAHYMCYTCTYSLCKGCTKGTDYVCVRGNKGFCTTCMRTIMLIENKDMGNNEVVQVDFDDKTSWEYLFKVYWIYLKGNLSLTLNELMQAKNPWKGVVKTDYKRQSSGKNHFANGGTVAISDKPSEPLESKMPNEQSELPNIYLSNTEKLNSDESPNLVGCKEWASKELLELVTYVRNGDTSMMSQFDVQALLLDYIKRNNLRDPRGKSQIICDLRLRNLFGKPRVGHIEMLKLLEYHFLIKEDDQKNAFIPAGIVGSVAGDLGPDQNNGLMLNQGKKRKPRRKGDERTPQTNLDEYAAIDLHNINLIYLRRNLMENLLGDEEKFHDKVVGSIVRIRVSCNDQKQDIYRLVQVVGTSKAPVPYKLGDKMIDVTLEILNLDKKETTSIDSISNQEFSQEECKRLRQSIKCGLVKQWTVGKIQTKAIELLAVRLNDVLEAETLRLNHLRDRANEKGHKKQLREYVEKLQLLKMPEERQRRLTEIPEVHADPKMNPDYKSEEDAAGISQQKQDDFLRSKYPSAKKKASQSISSKSRAKEEGPKRARLLNEKGDAHGLNSHENHENLTAVNGAENGWGNEAVARSGSETSTVPFLTGSSLSGNISQMEKMWHYRDPNGKTQGPFSMMQLRKWSTTGFFPADMRIWTNNELEDSLLLTDALNGLFLKVYHSLNNFPNTQETRSASDNSTFRSCNLEQTFVAPVDRGSGHENEKSALQHENQISHETRMSQITGGQNHEKPSNSQSYLGQSSGQKSRSLPLNLDLNHKDCNSSLASVTLTTDSTEQHGDTDLPSPTPNTSTGNLEGQAVAKQKSRLEVPVQDFGISGLPCSTPQPMDEDLRSTTPKPTNEVLLSHPSKHSGGDQGVQVEETKQSVLPKVSVPFSGTSWANASDIKAGGSQLPEIADEWAGYSPTVSKASVKEWNTGLISMASLKPLEVLGDQVAASNLNINQLAHSSPSHPVPNMSGWQGVVSEPIEFSTLAEESVSDLLAEVDAMESQGGLASPTSAMNCSDDMMDCRNDCFSSIEELSPTADAGKSDAVSSSAEVQFPSQSTGTDDPVGASQADTFDSSKGSIGHSVRSSGGETKSVEAPFNPGETDSDMHPPTCSMSQGMTVTPMARGRGLEPLDIGWPGMQGNVNMGWGGSPQGFPNMGWANGMGAAWGNPNFNLGAYNGSLPWDGQWRYGGERFASPREWSFQGGDSGFGRGRAMWSRQSHGVGYSRPPHKGQRVCKFYESGHCKKGASCDYLHP